jgi:hypothetical protein
LPEVDVRTPPDLLHLASANWPIDLHISLKKQGDLMVGEEQDRGRLDWIIPFEAMEDMETGCL